MLKKGLDGVAKGSNVGQRLVQVSLVGEAIDGGPVAVFVADEEMRYVAVNGFACELLGYTRDELLSKTIMDVAPGRKSAENYRELMSAGMQRGQIPLVRNDGTQVVLEYRAKATTVAALTFFVAVGWPVDDAASETPEPRRRGARARG